MIVAYGSSWEAMAMGWYWFLGIAWLLSLAMAYGIGYDVGHQRGVLRVVKALGRGKERG